MSFFSRLFGKQSRASANDSAAAPACSEIPHTLPLGLRVGAMISFDRTRYLAAPEAFIEQLPSGYQQVQCYGYADLGDSHRLHRFYLSDDAYLQVLTIGEEVDAVQAFVYCEQVNPANLAAFREFVASHAHLGASQIDYAGHRWQRRTNADAGDARIPPMALDETLYRGEPARRDDSLTNYAMLYGRPIAELDSEELLLVTAEDSGPNEFLVSYAVGLNLTSADYEIT